MEELLSGLETGLPEKEYPRDFGARVFKISRDSQGARLTWLKVTGDTLRPKELIGGGAGEERWEEKVDQLRLYSGEKFRTLEEAPAGTVCASVTRQAGAVVAASIGGAVTLGEPFEVTI